MGKIFFFLLALVIGGLYYVKQNNLFNLDKVSGAKAEKMPGVQVVPTTPEGIPIHQPIFQAGDCINHSKEGWFFYKITGYANDQYSYKYCERFKGCNPEIEQQHFSAFEKTYPLERKLEKCSP
ncbi:MAG: hypothetical protein A2X86_00300 [Bdellovibrionales bacterium GWA2_49_15]|nr:MAG: hypothetical protein A2X86_00300 [Bdellovibrionales bacterium GWA2_49_15]HAZ14483.1 hypothetical protein [Bdellovibrionales bacterium]